jgi:hypothetical protein
MCWLHSKDLTCQRRLFISCSARVSALAIVLRGGIRNSETSPILKDDRLLVRVQLEPLWQGLPQCIEGDNFGGYLSAHDSWEENIGGEELKKEGKKGPWLIN